MNTISLREIIKVLTESGVVQPFINPYPKCTYYGSYHGEGTTQHFDDAFLQIERNDTDIVGYKAGGEFEATIILFAEKKNEDNGTPVIMNIIFSAKNVKQHKIFKAIVEICEEAELQHFGPMLCQL